MHPISRTGVGMLIFLMIVFVVLFGVIVSVNVISVVVVPFMVSALMLVIVVHVLMSVRIVSVIVMSGVFSTWKVCKTRTQRDTNIHNHIRVSPLVMCDDEMMNEMKKR